MLVPKSVPTILLSPVQSSRFAQALCTSASHDMPRMALVAAIHDRLRLPYNITDGLHHKAGQSGQSGQFRGPTPSSAYNSLVAWVKKHKRVCLTTKQTVDSWRSTTAEPTPTPMTAPTAQTDSRDMLDAIHALMQPGGHSKKIRWLATLLKCKIVRLRRSRQKKWTRNWPPCWNAGGSGCESTTLR